MRFDGPTIADAWLAVFAAASRDKKLAGLCKTIAIEDHPTGIRLVATDRIMMLTAWVPDLDSHYDGPPAFDQAPDRVIVASDHDGRARSLLGYVLALANREDPEGYAPGTVELRLDFDVKLPPGTAGSVDVLDGMEPTYAVLSVPDVEKVYLEVVPTAYPDWRPIAANYQATSTTTVALDAEVVERLAKVRKHAGPEIAWSWGGSSGLAAVAFPESDPHIHGYVMPRSDDDIAVDLPTDPSPAHQGEGDVATAPRGDDDSAGEGPTRHLTVVDDGP